MSKKIDGYRLSPQQRRVWFLQQNSHAYRSHCAWLLKGDLQVRALKEAVHRVSNEQEILRTSFHQRPETSQVLQVIAPSSTPSWKDVDLIGRPSEVQRARITALLRPSKPTIDDLQNGPLLKVCLIALSPDEHILAMSLPALCADSAALRNLGRQVSRH